MVKTVLSVNHQGLRDWVFQRLSAIVMAVYSLGLVYYIVTNPGLSFATWHTLFSHVGMKVFTLIFLSSVLIHAWIGMWTIFTDYVKCPVLRIVLNFIVFFMLIACFFWGFLIVWSV